MSGIFEVVFLDNNDDFLDTCLNSFFYNEENGRFSNAVAVDDWEHLLLCGFGSRKQAGTKPGSGTIALRTRCCGVRVSLRPAYPGPVEGFRPRLADHLCYDK